uniref:hypothetical protein n=1 Tax=Sandarakinorhabdus sp. TaxID=1916663 RepID=UPI00286DB917
ENGFTSDAARTGFDGRTATRYYDRTRTDSGYTETGSVTRPNGSTYNLNGSRARTENGFARDRAITNADGGTVASRNVVAARVNGQNTRTVTSTGPQRLLTRHAGRAGRRG